MDLVQRVSAAELRTWMPSPRAQGRRDIRAGGPSPLSGCWAHQHVMSSCFQLIIYINKSEGAFWRSPLNKTRNAVFFLNHKPG